MAHYFETDRLSVGYGGIPLIRDIDLRLEKGKILTLIGPNGAGKSTILRSIARQLAPIGGCVTIQGEDIRGWSRKQLASRMAVVLTDRADPELMTCRELVATGRYPYTGLFGRLAPADEAAVDRALAQVHALHLAGQHVSTLSDGQRQRVMLARAICQEPEVIVLDEPTAYLDIRHKLELLDILQRMAREQQIAVIMSLHEIDLATKSSDLLLCVSNGQIAAFGPTEQVLADGTIQRLYDLETGSYDPLFGSVELAKPQGPPQIFVVAGGGCGAGHYRALQKRQIPFATGILFDNDVDCQVARALSGYVVSAPAFSPMSQEQFQQAWALMVQCGAVLDAGAPTGPLNQLDRDLLARARQQGLPIYHSVPQEVCPWNR